MMASEDILRDAYRAANSCSVLSIKQPYPHHIFHDGKDVENRDWPTRYRGWFMVHAGVSTSELDRDDEDEMAMPRGGIVGMARIVDCVDVMDSRWFYGKHGFVLADAFPLPLIKLRGALGFFKPDDATRVLVRQAIVEIAARVLPTPFSRGEG